MARPSNREKILDAYVSLIVEHGVTAATLDAVCERSGVSKGGLLYHFPAKADLQEGVFDRLEVMVDAFNASAPVEPAAIIEWFLTTADDQDPSESALWRALFATIQLPDDGSEAEVLSSRLAGLVARYSEALVVLDPLLAHIVRLVGDGIYFNRLSGGPPLELATRDAIVKHFIDQL